MSGCSACGYANDDEALVCNLCGAMLKAPRDRRAPPRAPNTQRAGRRHVLQPVGAPPRVLEVGKVLTIGRLPGAGLFIDSNRVSRYHAEIRWENDAPVLVDRGSANGTIVNGERVTVAALRDGDELEIGPFYCRYALEGGPKPAAYQPPQDDDEHENTQVILTTGGSLQGRLAEVSLAEVLQSIELNEKTGTLEVDGPEGKGWVALQDGQPLAAGFRSLEDEDAAVALILLTSGRFSFEQTLTVSERRMRTTVTGLLLEAGRRRDEQVVQEELAAAAAAAAALQRRLAEARKAPASPQVVGEETLPYATARGTASIQSEELLARATSVATRAIKRIDRFFLLTTPPTWNNLRAAGRLEPPAGGALRLASAGQVVRSANRFYRGQGPLVVLVVEPRFTGVAVRWEDPGDGQRVPMLPGPLPLGAVVANHPLVPGADGAFATPPWLSEV